MLGSLEIDGALLANGARRYRQAKTESMKYIRRILHLPIFQALNRYLHDRYASYSEQEIYPRGHYHSPLPDLAEVQACTTVLFRKDIDLSSNIDLKPDTQYSFLIELVPFYKDFNWPNQPLPEYRFYLDQPYFGHGDAIILSALLRYRSTHK